MRLLPKSIHWCRRYPTKFNSGRDIPYFNRFLDIVERVGNFLPHPASLFAIFALGVVVLSVIFANMDLSVSHPSTGETIEVISLLNLEGLHRMLTRMVTNFTSFAPLGTVFVSMLGIGLAESSGLIGAALKKLVLSAPPKLLTFAIVLAGVLSNMRARSAPCCSYRSRPSSSTP